MTKLFLTGIAVLFLATGTAHAADQLPEHMLGEWCGADNVSTATQAVYYRPNNKDPEMTKCSEFNDPITISREGYTEVEEETTFSCIFDKVERKEEEAYLTYAKCTNDHTPDVDYYNKEFQLIHGLLFKR